MSTEHIKIPDVTPIIRFTANGALTRYDFPFPIFAAEDLKVYFDGALQNSGYMVFSTGQTSGGYVEFDTAVSAGITITLTRQLPLERITDFIEGGDFSARAINNELDYMMSSVQQIARQQSQMLHYSDHENTANNELPAKAIRAGKALGFDGNGDPIAVELTNAAAAPNFTAQGFGAMTRSSSDKHSDLISIKDFGAIGDGLTDDTIAVQQALSAHGAVYIPEGTYLITSTISLNEGQSLRGAGQKSVLKASDNSFVLLALTADFITLQNFKTLGGSVGIKLSGIARPCVQCAVSDVSVFAADIGVQLDGGTNTNYPCYWNNFNRVLVEQMSLHGFHLMRSGAGDTPNANKFHACRAYSHGVSTTGSGFYVEEGQFNNSFIDCEANIAPTAEACFRLGTGSHKSLLLNPYAESSGGVPNIKLDAGSDESSIYNLLSVSDGAAIWDLSGGQYSAYSAGYPEKNFMQRTIVTDMKATLQRYDTEYIDASGTVSLDLSHSVHLVSSYSGALAVELPLASTAEGVTMTIKKIDVSGNIVTIREAGGGSGPDGSDFQLGGKNDYVTVISNGAGWYVTSSNRAAGNTRFYEGTGLYDIDMAVDTYLISSYGGALTARLPPANASEAIGRVITIKKTDPSGNAVTVTEQGAAGPDNYAQPLSAQYNAITVVSNGAAWYIVARF
tara:strand:- start:47425 stop:49452 length:2028 start_codon:yes stop_codon:yes gene_type:complete